MHLNHRRKRTLAILLAVLMVLGALAPAMGATDQPVAQAPLEIAPTQAASLIRPIADQTARVVEATRDAAGNITAGVDWGNEPVVVTIGYNYDSPWCYDDVEFDVDIAVEGLLDYTFTGVHGNILTLVPTGYAGHTDVTVTATEGNVVSTETFRVTINRYADTGEYEWTELEIHGAGAVGGYIFHPHVEGILYAQTDVGGTWRFEFEYDETGRAVGGRWYNITKWDYETTGNPGTNRNAPRMVGIDPTPGREDWVYMVVGLTGQTILRSTDRGDTWHRLRNADNTGYATVGISGQGNAGNWRSTGGNNFIIVPNRTPGTPANPALGLPAGYSQPTIYALSSVQNGGIRVSHDDGLTWSNDLGAGFPDAGPAPTPAPAHDAGTQWIHFDYCIDNPDFRIVTNGAGIDQARGGAWITIDGGDNWARLDGMPTSGTGNNQLFPRFSAARANFSLPLPADHPTAPGGRHIFVTFTSRAAGIPAQGQFDNPGGNDGQRGDGAVFRWTIDADGEFVGYAPGVTDTGGVNITPQMWLGVPVNATHRSIIGELNFHTGVGFIGNTVCRTTGALVVSTHNTDPYDFDTGLTNRGHETMFRSLDHGETWFPILGGFEAFGDLAFGEISGLASPAVNGPIQTNKWDYGPYHEMAITQRGTEIRHEPWSFLHWSFSPQINPHNPDNIFINSGLGTYVAYNLTALDAHAADGAVPNVRNYKGMSLAAARDGLFTATQTQTGGESVLREGLRITVCEDGLNPNRRVIDDYNAFRMNHSAISPNGQRTRAEMIRWETAPGIFMTVQMSLLFSPATGDNIVYASLADYPGFRFTSIDDQPFASFSWGQWIPEEWNYVYDGRGVRPSDAPGDAPFTGHAFDWQAHTDNLHPDLLPPRPTGLEDSTIWAPTYRGIFGGNTGFSEMNPNVLVSTQRMDWHSMTRGGAIISFDAGATWHLLPTINPTRHPAAPGGGAGGQWDLRTDHPAAHLLGTIPVGEMPNATIEAGIAWTSGGVGTSGRSVGHAFLSADGKVVLWAPPAGNGAQMQYRNLMRATVEDILARTPTAGGVDADGNLLRENPWTSPTIFAAATGDEEIGETTVIRIESDPVCGDTFFAFSVTAPHLWVSRDAGQTFRPVETDLNGFSFAGIDGAMTSTTGGHHGPDRMIRNLVGQFGQFHICGGNNLFLMSFDPDTGEHGTATFTRIVGNTAELEADDGFRVDAGISNVGTGANSPRHARGDVGLGPNLTNEFLETGFLASVNDVLYAHGTNDIGGERVPGVYRSMDGGETWELISPSAANSAGSLRPDGVPVAQGGTGEFTNANRPFVAVNGLTGDPRVFGRVFVSQGDTSGSLAAGDIVTTLLEDGDETVNLFFYIDEEVVYHINAEYGAIVEAPTTPDVPADYVFIGWFTPDGEQFDFSAPVTENAILHARWGHEVVVTFAGEGGQPATQTATVFIHAAQFEHTTYYADAFAAIDTPVRAEFVFQGWFTAQTGGTEVLATTQVTATENHTLFARWEAVVAPSVPVTGITGVPDRMVVGDELTLTGTVAPADATNRTIVWSTTTPGATIVDGVLTTTRSGPIVVTATIVGGNADGTDFVQTFTIIAREFHAAYMFGNPVGQFLPLNSITRAEVAAILARTMIDDFDSSVERKDYELPASMESFTVFPDVSESNWFYHYVAWAHHEGLVQGDANGRFNPNSPITRQELAAMLARTIAEDDLEETGTMAFPDANTIGGWARGYVYNVFRQGWMVGDAQGYFRPAADIRRAEVATAVNRLLGRVDGNPLRNALVTAEALEHESRGRVFPDVATTNWFFAAVLAAANDHYLTHNGEGVVDWMYIRQEQPWR